MTTGTAAPTDVLLTAEQYAAALPDDGRLTELVRGKVVEMPSPTPSPRVRVPERRQRGPPVRPRTSRPRPRGVQRQRCEDGAPDRTASAGRTSRSTVTPACRRGPLPEGYWPAPELVFEVKSPSDRWPAITAKAGEYLTAGVVCVCVVDPETESVAVYLADELPRRHTSEEELTLAEALPVFTVPIRQFFE